MIDNKEKLRALLMDPCPLTREGMKQTLVSSKCIGNDIIETGELYKIPLLVSKYKPNVLIMELYGQGESVLDALRVITLCRASWSNLPIVICTAIESPRLLTLVKNMGVRGMCLKSEPIDSIVNCVNQVTSDHCFFSSGVWGGFEKNNYKCTPLTAKEIDVIEIIFSGKTVTATSSMMSRDVRTVSTHKRNAMEKLGFRNDCDMFTHGDWMSKDKVFS
ncbi:response regulator transcription factor [Serratia fonticola]|uniref:response regulator transcription factor n=1 Tax=Serratia fonticola TaxID=47917 RepID=UPI0027E649FF|nr:response regulator transcription factor [Serratia fonticola]MDQ7212048.1 response regulator transcription factor [Serratia fonticola]HBE9082897.1 response regulator transcription factor [Serratia fonticola]HBE9093386.1 response regulator transcription factor [Serratia fonticola]HBE9155749.1 response regulator transcription factor [Serratia fonticola]